MQRATDEPVTPSLAGPLREGLSALGATIARHHATLVVDGRSLEVRFLHEPARAGVGVSVDYRGTGSRGGAPDTLRAIVLREEGTSDLLGKSLGINREVSLEDPAFDDAVYVESSAPDRDVRAALPEAARARIREMLSDTRQIVLYDGSFVVRAFFDGRDPDHVTADAIARRCRAVLALVDALPFDQVVTEDRPRRAHRYAVALAIVAMVVVGVWWQRDAGKVVADEPVVYGFALGAFVALSVAGAVAAAVRGRSDSFRVALEVGIPLVIVGGLFGAVGLPALNVLLDGSAGEVRALRVERSVVTRPSRGSPTLRVRLVGSSPEVPALDATLPAEEALRFATGTRCRATFHPGRFGWPWWDTLTRDESQSVER
jgi:hypothetical protein